MPMAKIMLICCQQRRLLPDFKKEMEEFVLFVKSQKPNSSRDASLNDVTPTNWHLMGLCIALISDPRLGLALRR